MRKKLIYLTCFILVLSMAGNASAELVARWKLDEGSGTTTADSAGDNDGTLYGDTSWTNGILDGALSFDGDGDYVDCGNNPALNPSGSFSITLWAYIRDWSTGWAESMFSKGGDHDRGGWVVRRFSSEVIVFTGAGFVATTQGENHNLAGNTPPPLNEWVHIACVYDVNNVAYIYINGAEDARIPASGTIEPTDASIYLGTRSNVAGTAPDDWSASYFDGMLDDVRFYNHALEEGELGPIMAGQEELPTPRASRPKPGNEATDVQRDTALSWKPGLFADTHNVYFGTVLDDVNEAGVSYPRGVLVSENQYETIYAPTDLLEFGRTYYWRVDEINAPPDSSVHKGEVWSFTTLNFLIVDDFEDYNDYPPHDIFSTWKDGYGIETNGALIGYDEPDIDAGEHFLETAVVRSGEQSLPYFYDNSGTANYSEAERAFSGSERDWTREGVAKLSLWFRGYPASVGSFVEGPAETYTMTGSGTDIWGTSDEFHFAFRQLDGIGSIIAKVESVGETDQWAKAGVMIRETLEQGSKHAIVCLTPSNGVAFQDRVNTDRDSFSAEQSGITAPHWVKLERDLSGDFTAYHSANGSTWERLGTPERIQMAKDTYIGLAVTAHNATATCEAIFSNVTITGSVSGQWANQDIGIISNDAEPIYVAVSNTGGIYAVVYHDDPNAAQLDTWTEWIIPLQEFADQAVDLTDIDRIAIGFGTKDSTTTSGGSGKMFFDDIRLYRPQQVDIENFSFELPGTEKIKGWNGEGVAGTPAVDIPGWSSDAVVVDSGVETGYTPTDGDWTAFLMSGDPSIWQLTGHTIADGDVLELKVDARITWAATTLRMTLYYDNNGARVPAATTDVALTDDMQEYTLSLSAADVPESVGKKIGIEFSNASSGDTWIGLDNVRLVLVSE
jgi:hypothetical protein